MSHEATAPIRQVRYLRLVHPGVVLLFRLGDRWQAYDDDATAAMIDLGEAGRPMGVGDERRLVVSLDADQAERWTKHLIAAGRSVAVAEQVGNTR